jgi:hypothetical protein
VRTVNLIYYNNGAGTTKDAKIIESILSESFKINHVDIKEKSCSSADINVFIQNVDGDSIEFVCCSGINVLIPNVEWIDNFSIDNMPLFNAVFAKSDECFRLFDKIHPNVIKTGFSSVDRYNPNIIKYPTFFHNGGKSIQKNTELVIDVFNDNGLPITILDATGRFVGETKPNIDYINHFVSEDELNFLYNSNQFHICCSINEGWGHYIYEALSSKALVITTNAPPMNEMLTKDECIFIDCHNKVDHPNSPFAKTHSSFPMRNPNYINRKDFEECVLSLNNQSFCVTDAGRNKYLSICENFSNTFKQCMSSL